MQNYLFNLGKNAKKASQDNVSSKKKNKVLKDYINLILNNQAQIISENQRDLKKAKINRLKENLIKRLMLDKKKIFQITNSIKTIIGFKDPVNLTLKKWIISSVSPKGELIIDDGAKKALRNSKSLLAAGIKRVSGNFKKGDHVRILDKSNKECARGLCSFSSDEIKKILGHHSNEIEQILGYIAKSEVFHKDDMVEFNAKLFV